MPLLAAGGRHECLKRLVEYLDQWRDEEVSQVIVLKPKLGIALVRMYTLTTEG